jgi:hypothetical protein
MRIRTFKQPMLHFVLIGVALFGAYRWMAPHDRRAPHCHHPGVVDDLSQSMG